MMSGLNLTYNNEDLATYSVSEYLLSLPSKNSRQSYASNLYNFFRFLHPETLEKRRLRGKKGEQFARTVDGISKEYVSNKQRYKAHINRYRDHISDYAPKSRMSMLTSVFSYLEYNNITFLPNYKKNIYGKEKEAISEEHVTSNSDIKRVCEFITLPEKTLTLARANITIFWGDNLIYNIRINIRPYF